MKIRVNKKKCVSAASCLVFADKTFQLDKNGKVEIKNPHGNSDEEILRAAQSCPVGAIELYDDTGQRIYPK